MAQTSEERLKILKMLEEEKITAEEATTLLRALEGRRRSGAARGMEEDRRYLRIHVSDMTTGASKVNVTMPMRLVEAGLRIAERFVPEAEDVDMGALSEAISSGIDGKVMEVADVEDNERVEIYVE